MKTKDGRNVDSFSRFVETFRLAQIKRREIIQSIISFSKPTNISIIPTQKKDQNNLCNSCTTERKTNEPKVFCQNIKQNEMVYFSSFSLKMLFVIVILVRFLDLIYGVNYTEKMMRDKNTPNKIYKIDIVNQMIKNQLKGEMMDEGIFFKI